MRNTDRAVLKNLDLSFLYKIFLVIHMGFIDLQNSREKLGDELARENAASLVCKYLKTYNKILQNDTKACKTTVTEDQNDLDDTKEGFRYD